MASYGKVDYFLHLKVHRNIISKISPIINLGTVSRRNQILNPEVSSSYRLDCGCWGSKRKHRGTVLKFLSDQQTKERSVLAWKHTERSSDKLASWKPSKQRNSQSVLRPQTILSEYSFLLNQNTSRKSFNQEPYWTRVAGCQKENTR